MKKIRNIRYIPNNDTRKGRALRAIISMCQNQYKKLKNFRPHRPQGKYKYKTDIHITYQKKKLQENVKAFFCVSMYKVIHSKLVSVIFWWTLWT